MLFCETRLNLATAQTLVHCTEIQYVQLVLSDLMVSLLANGPKVRWFKPVRRNDSSKAIKIRITPSFGEGKSRRSVSLDFTAYQKSLRSMNKDSP
jgi:hypothetical protein